MTDEDVIKRFHGLYAGAHCQAKRDAGDAGAMPPWTEVTWLGKQVVKCPIDLWMYQEIIWETRPQIIIETGTGGGGSAFYFATLFSIIGEGQVLTIDTAYYPELLPNHDRITHITGDSVSVHDVILGYLSNLYQGVRKMVVLDSLHTYEHVKRELELYAPLVSPGCYLVVEDTGWGSKEDTESGNWCNRAVAEFLKDNLEFEADLSRERHLITSNHGGWIRRKVL
jgi:cephalosporin hydroxylase